MVEWLDCLKEFEGGGGVGSAGKQVKLRRSRRNARIYYGGIGNV